MILSLSLFVLSGLDSFGGKESSKKLHSYLVPSLDKLHRHQLPRRLVAHQLGDAKVARADVLDLFFLFFCRGKKEGHGVECFFFLSPLAYR